MEECRHDWRIVWNSDIDNPVTTHKVLECMRCQVQHEVLPYIAELRAELEVAQGHARNHHLEACKSCAVEESDNISLRAENAALLADLDDHRKAGDEHEEWCNFRKERDELRARVRELESSLKRTGWGKKP